MSDRLLKYLLGMLGLALVTVLGVGWYIYNNDIGEWSINWRVGPSATATATPTETPTAVGIVSMMRVEVPADSSCQDCHKAGAIDIPNVPALGHPLEGWSNCASCHGEKKLVTTAPGHRGIHRDSCLLCHQQRSPSAPAALPRPHHTYPGKSCTDCHKPGGSGPLPQSMANRKNCWVCHTSAKNQDLFDTSTTS